MEPVFDFEQLKDATVYITPFCPVSMGLYHMLKSKGIKTAAFCDDDAMLAQKQYDGCQIISRRQLLEKGVDAKAVFMLASLKFQWEIYEELRQGTLCQIHLLHEVFCGMPADEVAAAAEKCCLAIDAQQAEALYRAFGNPKNLALLMAAEAQTGEKTNFNTQTNCDCITLNYQLAADADFLVYCFEQQAKGCQMVQYLSIQWDSITNKGFPAKNSDADFADVISRIVKTGVVIRNCEIAAVDIVHWMEIGQYARLMDMLCQLAGHVYIHSRPRVVLYAQYTQLADTIKESVRCWNNANPYEPQNTADNFSVFTGANSNISLGSTFIPAHEHEENPYIFFPHENENRCIHIHGSVTASMALAKHLFDGVCLIHGPLIQDYEKANEQKCRRYFKFSLVRNPWDRLRSIYIRENQSLKSIKYTDYYPLYKKEKGLPNEPYPRFSFFATFKEAVMAMGAHGQYSPKSQWESFLDSRGNMVMDYVGRYEELEQAADYLARQLGKTELISKGVAQGFAPVTGKNTYISHYDDEMKRIVAEQYRQEIEFFGYKFS